MDLRQAGSIKIRSFEIRLPRAGNILLKVKRGFYLHGSIWICYPEYRHILNLSGFDINMEYEIGFYSAQSRLVIALITLDEALESRCGRISHLDCCPIERLQQDKNKWEIKLDSRHVEGGQESRVTAVDIEIIDELSYSANEVQWQGPDSLKAPRHGRNILRPDSIRPDSIRLDSLNSNASKEKSPSELPHNPLFASLSSSVSGKTSDYFMAILSWNCLAYSKKTLILSCNNGNDLMYRIRGYAKSGSLFYNELWAETTLTHGDTQPFIIEGFYSVIKVEVRSAIAGKDSSFVLDYCAGT